MDLRERDPAHPHRHPWELSRRARLLALLEPVRAGEIYVDIGAGDLFFAEGLAERGASVLAVDSAYAGAAAAPAPRAGIERAADARDLPPARADNVLLLDVLEHAPDDGALLATAARLLKPGGRLLLTAPAGPRLFSQHDRSLGHLRRYRRAPLADLVRRNGFEVGTGFTFYASLWLLRAAQVALEKLGRPVPPRTVARWPFAAASPWTRALVALLNLDFAAGRLCGRMCLPCPGLSICLRCRKKSA